MEQKSVCLACVILLLLLGFSTSSIPMAAQGFPTPTVSSPNIVIQDYMGVEMLYVPGGKYTMGVDIYTLQALCSESSDEVVCLREFEWTGILEQYSVQLPPFWIDRYEVTIKVYQSCVDVGVCSAIDLTDSPQFNAEQKPQVGVKWYQAVQACNQRGARLPTEEEWEYAASGPNKLVFPWGNLRVPENLPAVRDETVVVGSAPKNKSWVGAYDMAGNAAEWVENIYLPYKRNEMDMHHFSDSERVTRGSSWGNGDIYAATFVRGHVWPEELALTNGFRCARFSDPRN